MRRKGRFLRWFLLCTVKLGKRYPNSQLKLIYLLYKVPNLFHLLNLSNSCLSLLWEQTFFEGKFRLIWFRVPIATFTPGLSGSLYEMNEWASARIPSVAMKPSPLAFRGRSPLHLKAHQENTALGEESEAQMWHRNSTPARMWMEMTTCFLQAPAWNSSWIKAKSLQMLSPPPACISASVWCSPSSTKPRTSPSIRALYSASPLGEGLPWACIPASAHSGASPHASLIWYWPWVMLFFF